MSLGIPRTVIGANVRCAWWPSRRLVADVFLGAVVLFTFRTCLVSFVLDVMMVFAAVSILALASCDPVQLGPSVS